MYTFYTLYIYIYICICVRSNFGSLSVQSLVDFSADVIALTIAHGFVLNYWRPSRTVSAQTRPLFAIRLTLMSIALVLLTILATSQTQRVWQPPWIDAADVFPDGPPRDSEWHRLRQNNILLNSALALVTILSTPRGGQAPSTHFA